ncbi:MAG TPA: hypothetical protein VFB19_07940 [Mycobacterium sp.]|nr:hypothetical protein [Mycobacterium sp.]
MALGAAGVAAAWLPSVASLAILDAILIALLVVLFRRSQRHEVGSSSYVCE